MCVALLGSAVYVKISEIQPQQEYGLLTSVELPELVVPVYATEDVTDTDNDGLKDWQEVIQGTDMEDADSDDDGTKDGDEVAADRNPLKPGPDDKGNFTTELNVGATDIYSEYVPRTLTDNVSKDLFSAYLQAKSKGTIDTDTNALADIANSIAQETLAKNEMVEKYTVASIGTFEDDDIKNGTIYGQKFAAFYIKMLFEIKQSNGDLPSIAREYQNFSKNITSIYVPESLAATQAEIGNNFYNVALMFTLINNADKDPLRATVAIKNMKELMGKQQQLFTSVANYFRRNGILFENQDIQKLWENI